MLRRNLIKGMNVFIHIEKEGLPKYTIIISWKQEYLNIGGVVCES